MKQSHRLVAPTLTILVMSPDGQDFEFFTESGTFEIDIDLGDRDEGHLYSDVDIEIQKCSTTHSTVFECATDNSKFIFPSQHDISPWIDSIQWRAWRTEIADFYNSQDPNATLPGV